MTTEQLQQLNAKLAEEMPGWEVARGGPNKPAPAPATGIQPIMCCSLSHLRTTTIVINFDTMEIIGAQG